MRERFLCVIVSICALAILSSITSSCTFAVDPQSYAARITGQGDDGNTYVGTVIYAKYLSTAYVITAYHNVNQRHALSLVFDEKSLNKIPLGDFVEPSASLDPVHDLAIFRCTAQGALRLEGSWKGLALNRHAVILKTGPQNYNGTHVDAVGNPHLTILDQDLTPLNYVAGATVSEYSELGKRFISFANNTQLSKVLLLFLENLQVTHGFSGGPVLFSRSQFKDDDVELVGMVEGGDVSNGAIHSWAIPVDAIFGAVTNAGSFSAFPPANWPAQLLSDNSFSRTERSFITILQVTPWTATNPTHTVPLQVSEDDDLSVTLRAAGDYKELAAILHPPPGVEILKSPGILRVNQSGLFSFIWKVKPSADSKDGAATIEFTTESGAFSFRLPLNIQIVNEPSSRLADARAIAVLPIQFQAVQKISAHFDGKTEVDLRDDFGFEQVFKINVQVVLGSYRKKAFNEPFNLAPLLKSGPTLKVLEGGGGVVDKDTGKFHPEKSTRIVRGLLLPESYTQTVGIFNEFGDSAFLTEKTRKLIADYIALADENTTILGDVLNDSALELPKRYPKASDDESDIWINNRWVDRFKNLSPKAREIQQDLRTYVFTNHQ
jgi:hypothetical protein